MAVVLAGGDGESPPWPAGLPVRVLIVDDNDLIRDAAADLMAARAGFEVVGQAASGEAAVRLARLLEPDLVLMDFVLPGLSGAEATGQIVRHDPAVRVIMLLPTSDRDYQRAANFAGAVAGVAKDRLDEDLLPTIANVVTGA